MGWLTGLEPATTGTTIQYSNQLSYSHHDIESKGVQLNALTYPESNCYLSKIKLPHEPGIKTAALSG
jgi:hypothetical protein